MKNADEIVSEILADNIPLWADIEFLAREYKDLRARIAALEVLVSEKDEALRRLIDGEPRDGQSGYACTWCDMGSSGYATKGDAHHDDKRHVCPVLYCQQALSLTQSHPRILAIGKVLGALKKIERECDCGTGNKCYHGAYSQEIAAAALKDLEGK